MLYIQLYRIDLIILCNTWFVTENIALLQDYLTETAWICDMYTVTGGMDSVVLNPERFVNNINL